jgi:U4/U6 small nuclear ribonucleoprotein PRP3
LERNEQNKLTKAQRSAKLQKKLQEDTTSGVVHVALFHVKDMTHPYHRTKVDLNAQQSNITGGVLECSNPKLACVICEGGPKAIKRYTRLLLVRMKWKGPDDQADEEESDDGDEQEEKEGVVRHKFNPENKCELVWTGMATKRFFKGFVFQACDTSDQAGKILRAKGVGHFWDQVLTHASGRGESFQLKLAESSDDDNEDEEESGVKNEGGDVEMGDAATASS